MYARVFDVSDGCRFYGSSGRGEICQGGGRLSIGISFDGGTLIGDDGRGLMVAVTVTANFVVLVDVDFIVIGVEFVKVMTMVHIQGGRQ